MRTTSEPPRQAVDTAVIPLAGLGTRMYPAAASVPKFMLPVIEHGRAVPNIDFTLRDLMGAGVRNFVFIVDDDGDKFLRRYMGPLDLELEKLLRHYGKTEDLEALQTAKAAFAKTSRVFVKQDLMASYGTAAAVACTKDALRGVKCFAVYGGDDFIYNADGTSEFSLLLEGVQQSGTRFGVVGVSIPREEAPRYGILQQRDDGRLRAIIEKPPLDEVAERPVANVTRFIVGEELWSYMDAEMKRPCTPERPEYLFTDVITAMAQDHDFYLHRAHGKYYDAGTPQSILVASNALSI